MANDVLTKVLKNRWNVYTTAPSVTASAVVAAAGPQSRHNVESIIYSIYNKGAGAGTQFTLTFQLRHASIAGTVIFALDHNVPSSTAAQVAITNLGLAGKRGTGIHGAFSTVIGSVTQTVNLVGWTDDSNG